MLLPAPSCRRSRPRTSSRLKRIEKNVRAPGTGCAAKCSPSVATSGELLWLSVSAARGRRAVARLELRGHELQRVAQPVPLRRDGLLLQRPQKAAPAARAAPERNDHHRQQPENRSAEDAAHGVRRSRQWSHGRFPGLRPWPCCNGCLQSLAQACMSSPSRRVRLPHRRGNVRAPDAAMHAQSMR